MRIQSIHSCMSCFVTQFLCQTLSRYPENPKGTQVIVGSMNKGYISDTTRNRTHNLFRPKREPIPLCLSDGRTVVVFVVSVGHYLGLNREQKRNLSATKDYVTLDQIATWQEYYSQHRTKILENCPARESN